MGTEPDARYPWSGCGFPWNERIFGIGKYGVGTSFMVHIEKLVEKEIFRMVYLTDKKGDLIKVPTNIRVDSHIKHKTE